MDEPLFYKDKTELFEILESSDLCKTEIELRKKRLIESIDLIQKTESREYYNRFNQLAHEIRSIPFLKQFGNLKITEDSKNSKGCDFVLNGKVYIECVCVSEGQADKSGLEYPILSQGVHSYNEIRNLINLRFTNTLKSKLEFYEERVGESIPEDKPYIIYVSSGGITEGWFCLDGNALFDVLYGMGNMTITIDPVNLQVLDSGFTHNTVITKPQNEVEVDCNIFRDVNYEDVSAILLTSVIHQKYTFNNTYLYINPMARHKIEVTDFLGIKYCEANANGDITEITWNK